jgi:L,D-peptidoglycan transpeptidase YkuD (ErfK/YbiS/YcfS/YnhG family)
MIIVKKTGYLKYKNFKFRCAIGRSGIKKKKLEGDGITPKGTYKIIKIYYRPDKIKNLKTVIKKIKIKRNMGWCDDPGSNLYNKQIRTPSDLHHEKLYRNDNLYDVLLVLNYNLNPIKKNKGSGIFLHVANSSYGKTEGCIALKKKDLIKLVSNIKKNEEINIG